MSAQLYMYMFMYVYLFLCIKMRRRVQGTDSMGTFFFACSVYNVNARTEDTHTHIMSRLETKHGTSSLKK